MVQAPSPSGRYFEMGRFRIAFVIVVLSTVGGLALGAFSGGRSTTTTSNTITAFQPGPTDDLIDGRREASTSDEELADEPASAAVPEGAGGSIYVDRFCALAADLARCRDSVWDSIHSSNLFENLTVTIEIPAGLVNFEAIRPIDPVRGTIHSNGMIRGDDVGIYADYPAANLLADALVSPAYQISVPDHAPAFGKGELTIPYRQDFIHETDVNDLRVAVFDPTTEVWSVAPGPQLHDFEKQEITIEVTGHFTSYAVIRFPTTEALRAHQVQTD